MSIVTESMTPQQLAACGIDRDRWLVVGAGAGAGKTKVLAARMVCLLEAGEPLTSIVAMTFTRKAAEEMGTRVRRLLDDRINELEALQEPSDDTRKRLGHLVAAREEFHRRRITTIDSFCRTQLLANAFEAGLPPGFDQLDELQEAEAISAAVKDTRRQLTPLARQELDNAVSASSLDEEVSASTRRAAAAFLNLHRAITSPDAIDGILKTLLRRHDDWEAALRAIGISTSDNEAEYSEACEDWIAGLEDRLTPLRARIAAKLPWQETIGTADPREAVKRLRQLADELNSATSKSSPAKFSTWLNQFIAELPTDGIPTKAWCDDIGSRAAFRGKPCPAEGEILDRYDTKPPHFTKLKNAAVEGFKDYLAVDEGIERRWFRVMTDAAMVMPIVREHFAAYKGDALTFAELKRLLLLFVTPGPAYGAMPPRSDDLALRNARAVASGIRWLMVDEFQDTDPAQWDLFLRLVEASHSVDSSTPTHPGMNLYVVGDDKQSIYRFRGADASVFATARDRASMHNREGVRRPLRHPVTSEPVTATNSIGGHLDPAAEHHGLVRLTANFRSAAEPLLVGNHIFQRIFSLIEPETDAPARDAQPFDAIPQDLEPGQTSKGKGFVTIVPFKDARDEDDEEDYSASHSPDGKSEAIPRGAIGEARVVAKLIKSHRDSEKLKRWEDAAVLVATNAQADLIREALAASGIPYVVSGGKGLLRRTETRDLWALCAAMADRDNDLAIAALLRSPIFGVTDEGLLTMSHYSRGERGAKPRFSEALARPESWESHVKDLDHERAGRELPGSGDFARLQRAARLLAQWRRRATHTRPTDLIRGILDEVGSAAHGAGPGLMQRAANVGVLLNALRASEARGDTLGQFADWLHSQLEVEESSISEGQPEDDPLENGGGVQVMTIHQSKGKEFDVVFLPFLGGQTRSFPDLLRVAGSGTCGPMASIRPRLGERDDPEKYIPVAERLIDTAERIEGRAERRRMFYVAWTRAKTGIVALLPVEDPSKPGKEIPIPEAEPDAPVSAASLLYAALGVSPQADQASAALKAAFLDAAEDVGSRGGDGAAEGIALAAALRCVEITELVDPGTLVLSPDTYRRALVATLASGNIPRGSALDIAATLSPEALALAMPLTDPTRDSKKSSSSPRTPMAVTIEEVGILNEGLTTPQHAPSDIEDTTDEDWIGLVGGDGETLAATEFGTVVHELMRVAIQSKRLTDSPNTAWLQRIARQVAGRLRPGLRLADHQAAELARHAANGIKLMSSRSSTGQVILEFELTDDTATRRLDCAIETALGHWLVIDFKTSPSDSSRGEEYAAQLREYAVLLAQVLSSRAKPLESVSTVLLHTGDATWGFEQRYTAAALLGARARSKT